MIFLQQTAVGLTVESAIPGHRLPFQNDLDAVYDLLRLPLRQIGFRPALLQHVPMPLRVPYDHLAELLHAPPGRLAPPFAVLLPPGVRHLHAQPVHAPQERFRFLHAH
ncbi:MAG: hypothetical protein AAB225_15845, partial [Acidobacteriota bacterium]